MIIALLPTQLNFNKIKKLQQHLKFKNNIIQFIIQQPCNVNIKKHICTVFKQQIVLHYKNILRPYYQKKDNKSNGIILK